MNSKISLILIASIALAFLSFPGKAETGVMTITQSTGNSYTSSVSTTSDGPLDFTKMAFDSGDFTNISEIILTTNGATFTKQAGSSPFTITSGGTGTGTVSYDSNTRQITWFFNSGTSITSSPVTISYSVNVLGDITQGAGYAQDGAAVDSTHPVYFYTTTNSQPAGCRLALGGCTYFVQTQLTFSNNYNVTYSGSPTIANVSISKAGTSVNSKINIINSTASKFQESSFNHVSFSFAFQYDTGIALYMNDSLGDSVFKVVNTTNYTGGGAPPINNGSAGTNITSCTKPSTGATVCFDKSSYTVGDNINATWFLSDATQNDLFNKKLRLTLNGVPLNTGSVSCGGCVDITTQQGFYIAQATQPGVFEADVLEGIIQYTNIGSNTVIINAPSNSWIAITNTTMYTRTLNNVTYHIGYSVANYPAAAIEIDINDVATGNLIDVLFPTIFPDGTMQFGAVHPIPVGNYSVRLIDDVKNQVLDTKYFTAIPSPLGVPVAGIKTSSITTDKSTYFYNDYMQVSYQVDDTNFSNFNYTLMAHIIALDKGNITTKMFITPFADQVGTFTSIVNINKNMRCDKGLNCWFETGNNSINLVLMNTTTGTANAITLAFANFTVSSTTVDGYGLSLSTTTPNTNEVFTATTTVPAGRLGLLKVANAGTIQSIVVLNQTVGNSTTLSTSIQTIPIMIQPINANAVAYYVVNLYGDDNLLKVSIPITVNQVSQVNNPTNWKPPQANVGAFCSYWDGWVSLMFGTQGLSDNTRFEFALLIIGAVTFLIGAWTKNLGTGIAAGFVPYAFFGFVSLSTPCGLYVPAWTLVFIALILIAKQRWL